MFQKCLIDNLQNLYDVGDSKNAIYYICRFNLIVFIIFDTKINKFRNNSVDHVDRLYYCKPIFFW
jgi:hypothetical protein